MKPKRSTALVVRTHNKTHSSKAEKLPPVEALTLPAALLLAAETTSLKDTKTNPHLAGVFVHSREGRGRVAGTDSSRLFVGSFELPEENVPSWLAEGVILSGDNLRSRVSMLLKLQSDPLVRIAYAKGTSFATLSDLGGASAVFRVPIVSGEFPNYEVALRPETFSRLDEDGNPVGKEWEPIGLNSQYLKHCGDIAKVLDAGLPKEERSKNGMVVRAFNSGGDANAPLVFDFSSWPGAILVIQPLKLASFDTRKETAELLAPAVRGSVAALRAHATRWLQRSEAAESEAEKAAALAKSAEFQARVAELLKRLPGLPAITAEPQPEPEAQSDSEPQPEPEDEPSPDDEDETFNETGPKVTRQRVNVRQAA